MQLRVGESPGIDGIPAEFYHQGEEAMFDKLQDLFTNCWGGGGGEGLYRRTSGTRSLSMEKKKKKGEQPDCSNYQGIFLLSTDGRILACVLLNRFILR